MWCALLIQPFFARRPMSASIRGYEIDRTDQNEHGATLTTRAAPLESAHSAPRHHQPKLARPVVVLWKCPMGVLDSVHVPVVYS
jgi:hypothetical protein